MINRAVKTIVDYQAQNLKLQPRLALNKPSVEHRDNCWTSPPRTTHELNVDAHHIGDGRWGLGFVLRRSDGRPVVVATKVVDILGDATTVEVLGIKLALDWISEARWENVIIESDAKKVVDYFMPLVPCSLKRTSSRSMRMVCLLARF